MSDSRFYARLLSDGSLGFGESYMDGWWQCDALDQCVERIYRSGLPERVRSGPWRLRLLALQAKLTNLQSVARSFRVSEAHYGIGNDFYQAMLDREFMAYTCGYWKHATTLEAAQRAKVDLVCRKAGLKPGMQVLDMGCGWGSFAKYAAETYGVHVFAFCNSREMVALAQERCRGLDVEVHHRDYRDVHGQFDAVVAIGIMEHIGPKNYGALMAVAHRCLRPEGIFVLHTITNTRSYAHAMPWVHKYIFPDAVAPSIAQIGGAIEGRFVLEDVQNFGPDYAPTLMAWYDNFNRAWPQFRDRYGERFHRMWSFYLLGSAGAARARDGQVCQLVMTRAPRAQPECRVS